MNTKEAIEYLENDRKGYEAEYYEMVGDIINLLLKGEKRKTMWEELKDLMKKEPVNKYKCDYCVSLTCNWRFPMKDLEKRYFPEEASK